MVSTNAAIGIAAGTAVAGVALGFGIGAVVFAGGGDSSESARSSSPPLFAPTSTTTTSRKPVVLPQPTDFAVDVAVTEQKCFGSAGCNYELAVHPRYIGATDVDDAASFIVTYEIIGGEDPQTGKITVNGGNMRWDQEARVTADANTTFSTRIVQILPQY